MALVKAWLNNRLNTATGILAITGSARAYPIYTPQDKTKPFITFALSQKRRDYTTAKNDGCPFATFEINCWHDEYEGCELLADATRTAIDGYTINNDTYKIDRAFVVDESDIPEPPEWGSELPKYGVQLVLEVAHTETVPTYT